MDPANVSDPDFRPLHRLVPGARSHCQMDGRFFGWHMARLGEQFQVAAHAPAPRHASIRPAGARREHSRCNSRKRGASVLHAGISEAPRIVLRWAFLEGGPWARLRKDSPAAAASSAVDPPG